LKRSAHLKSLRNAARVEAETAGYPARAYEVNPRTGSTINSAKSERGIYRHLKRTVPA
jgi:hypothetical protein